MNQDFVLTIKDIADLEKISCQAVHLAIKKGDLKAEKLHNIWIIRDADFITWKQNKYSRAKRKMPDGSPMFSDDKLSVKDVAKLHQCSESKVYYAIYKGSVKAEQVGSQYVIPRKEAEKVNQYNIIRRYTSKHPIYRRK